MRPEDKKSVIITGTFVVLLLLVTAVSLFLISKENKLFSIKATLSTTVSNAQSVREGAAVHFKGIKIGSVSAIDILSVDKIKISLQVEDNYLKWIKEDSHIAFRTQGVLGDKYLEILGGNEDSPSVKTNHVLTSNENSQFDQFINKGEDILVVATRVLQKIDAIMGPVDNSRMGSILDNLETASIRANKLFSSVEPKKLSSTLDGINKASTSLGNVMSRIEKGPGTAHSLIYDPTVHEDLKSLLGGAQRSKVLQYFIRETIKDNNR
ncbi:MAG: hypothetical protein CME71_10745 [Halobacteriovorax sp.]|nr:hypothetical protein [Halobacteriovorax sp.]|tara:strand:+ start:382 stop:1179 length:798 start_codon:yes stop_codon:yes gene_type:complete